MKPFRQLTTPGLREEKVCRGSTYNSALRIHIQAQVFLGAQTLRSSDVGVARRSSVVAGKNCI